VDRDCYLASGKQLEKFEENVFHVVPKYKYDANNALREVEESFRNSGAIGEVASSGSPSAPSSSSPQSDGDGGAPASSASSAAANTPTGDLSSSSSSSPQQQQQQQQLASMHADEFERLRLADVAECEENNSEYDRMAGKQITYGSVVQLQHAKSGKFLVITVREIAQLERHCLKATLTENGEEGSWLVITPRFKTRSEGDRVLYGDQVVLVSKLYSVNLHTSQQTLADGRHEVNGFQEAVRHSWRVLPYSPYAPNAERYLKAGDVARLFHRDQGAYLTKRRDPDRGVEEVVLELGTSNSSVRASTSSSKSRVGSSEQWDNSNSLWMLERELPRRGGILRYTDQFRLKHLASGGYLM
jgi:predicted DNA-binding protein (UPF0251 family)